MQNTAINIDDFDALLNAMAINDEPINFKSVAHKLGLSLYKFKELLDSNEKILECYLTYAELLKHLELYDKLLSFENISKNHRLQSNFVNRSKYGKHKAFSTDLDIKMIQLNINTPLLRGASKSFIPEVNSVYYSLFNSKARYNIIYGGAGSGKSYAVALWMLFKVYTSPHPIRVLYGRKNYAHIKQSQFALFKSLITKYNLTDEFTINKTDYRITCNHNNAELIAIGMDDPEKIKSIFDPVAIWIEEATELKKEDFEQLDLRLRTSIDTLQIIFTFNPISRKHWLREVFVGDEDVPLSKPKLINKTISIDDKVVNLSTLLLKTNYKDNHFLPPEYIAALEKLKIQNPEYYNIYVNAEWGDTGQGWLFKRDFFDTYDNLPMDARGVLYCDPNLSKKLQGDTTAMIKLLFSPATQLYYVTNVICRKYSDSNELLKDLFDQYRYDDRIFSIAFDGNVNQESQWTQHIRNYSQMYNIPVPVVDYKHYNVDDLAKNASILWCEGRIKFRKGLDKTKDGEEFLTQLYSFAGKKQTKTHDDAPDALICAIQALFERGYRVSSASLDAINNLI